VTEQRTEQHRGEDARLEVSHGLRSIDPRVPGIDAWLCELERTTAEIDDLFALLSPHERERASRFGTAALRNRWIAGRSALRHILGNALGIAPAAVALDRGRRGRPQLADAGSRIDFNVSHTRGMAFICIARDVAPTTRIGVDIEHADRDVGVDLLSRKFLTSRERETLAGLSLDARRRRFLRYWTCKEAMSKATADGIIAPFGRLDVDLSDPPRLCSGPPPYVPVEWSLQHAEAPPAWIATVAIWRKAA